ncbi:MAG: caspase family protein [Deltaproteobacteria bacterium]|nr:caspase family protein [Deltaproteobacteria bacterium]
MRAGLAGLLAMAAALVQPEAADADERRFALIAANNTGNSTDPAALRYAREDAQAMADLLVDLGSFAAPDVMLLPEASAESLREGLKHASAAVSAAAKGGLRTLFLFFYSGHAGLDGLHPGATLLSGAELTDLLAGVEADVRVAVIDACHSGALAGIKGATPTAPFLLELPPPPESRGTAWLMSSGSGEKSQESSEYRHSIFTWWLMSALRGAADTSGDGFVTVAEAWEYARAGTTLTSTRTGVAQRPVWKVELSGADSVLLTSVHAGGEGATLQLESWGDYWIFRQGQALAAEVHALVPGRQVALAPGAYLVRRVRADDGVREAVVSLSAGGLVRVGDADLVAVRFERLADKGRPSANLYRSGPQALLEVQTEPLFGFGPWMGGGIGWPVLAGPFWLTPRILSGTAQLSWERERVRMVTAELGLAVGYAFDLAWLLVEPRVAAGAVMAWQEWTRADGAAEHRSSAGTRLSGGMALRFLPFDQRVFVELGAEGGTFVHRRDSGDGSSAWSAAPLFRFLMGFGYVL